jgi:ATP/maltotriose-dependent transcriptional regulator MalT
VLIGLGDVLSDRGDLVSARKSYEESLALRNQVGEKQTVAETEVALAQISIEENHPAEAEAAMRKCTEQFHREQQVDDELSASVVLIESLLAEGKYPEAKQTVEKNEALAKNSQNRLVRLQFALASARVLLASGQARSSQPVVSRVLAEAQHYGFLGLALQARLTLAELESKTGQTTAAQAQYASLERVANTKGFGLIAQKAAAGSRSRL